MNQPSQPSGKKPASGEQPALAPLGSVELSTWTPAGIYVATTDGRIVSCNARFAEMVGATPEELVNASPLPAPARPPTASGTTSDGPVVRRDGGSFWATRAERLVDHEGTTLVAGTMIDASVPHASTEVHYREVKMEAVGRLAGGLAHDFNNLLAVILNYAAIMTEDLAEQDPMRQDVEEIHRAAQRAAALARRLLLLSGRTSATSSVVDVNDAVRELIGPGAKGPDGIAVVARISAESAHVRLDPAEFETAIAALVENAREAMPNGGTLTLETRNVEIEEGAEPGIAAGTYLALSVSDTGAGMSDEVRSSAFEPFFTTKTKGKGIGLGLAIAYSVARHAGGFVTLRSELGRGTVVTLLVPPTNRRQGGRVSTGPQRAVRRTTPSTRETVLVVEDEDAVRAVACRILVKNGYAVLDARSPGDALLLCEKHKGAIHLLLTDVVMPKMSGKELADRVVANRPDVRVLFMSGYTGEAIAEYVLDAAVELLPKPFSEEGLLARVRSVLEAQPGAPDDAPRAQPGGDSTSKRQS